jgi:hypothetical protein
LFGGVGGIVGVVVEEFQCEFRKSDKERERDAEM